MLVKDIMSTRVEAVRPATTIGECARKMEQLGVGALPVWHALKIRTAGKQRA